MLVKFFASSWWYFSQNISCYLSVLTIPFYPSVHTISLYPSVHTISFCLSVHIFLPLCSYHLFLSLCISVHNISYSLIVIYIRSCTVFFDECVLCLLFSTSNIYLTSTPLFVRVSCFGPALHFLISIIMFLMSIIMFLMSIIMFLISIIMQVYATTA